MSKIIDISLPIHHDMVVWPGSPKTEIRRIATLKTHGFNGTSLTCDSHAGTHVDAPLHFLSDGRSVEKLSLDVLIGRAQVIYLPGITEVSADVLQTLDYNKEIKRLLFKTGNSKLWTDEEFKFHPEFVALTADAAQWIVDHDIELVGVDYLSVGRFKKDGIKTHNILLSSGVVLVEGLNLSEVNQGEYELICLPLKVIGAEGAPARAILRGN